MTERSLQLPTHPTLSTLTLDRVTEPSLSPISTSPMMPITRSAATRYLSYARSQSLLLSLQANHQSRISCRRILRHTHAARLQLRLPCIHHDINEGSDRLLSHSLSISVVSYAKTIVRSLPSSSLPYRRGSSQISRCAPPTLCDTAPRLLARRSSRPWNIRRRSSSGVTMPALSWADDQPPNPVWELADSQNSRLGAPDTTRSARPRANSASFHA